MRGNPKSPTTPTRTPNTRRRQASLEPPVPHKPTTPTKSPSKSPAKSSSKSPARSASTTTTTPTKSPARSRATATPKTPTTPKASTPTRARAKSTPVRSGKTPVKSNLAVKRSPLKVSTKSPARRTRNSQPPSKRKKPVTKSPVKDDAIASFPLSAFADKKRTEAFANAYKREVSKTRSEEMSVYKLLWLWTTGGAQLQHIHLAKPNDFNHPASMGLPPLEPRDTELPPMTVLPAPLPMEMFPVTPCSATASELLESYKQSWAATKKREHEWYKARDARYATRFELIESCITNAVNTSSA